MTLFKNLTIFVLANAIGFFSAHICFFIGMATGLISAADPDFNPEITRQLFHGIIITWMICALFSLSSFFLKGGARISFLLAPAVLPLAYGLSVLILL